MSRAKHTSKRGNADLHAQAITLSQRPWGNSAAEWKALEAVVTQLGAAAPKAAKEAIASRQRSMRLLPNPFGG
ncbi:hypothetical protein [Bradyrhizobium elkanii]|jgi:hypothetical protein|uniref:hypothetical protein n=1 Tax=Bradyrhizobium elkanii TaxID=29448 RepID=UPI00209E08A9|nr:hypothetical protein [Bradyrhizobium elkanii]MCP1757905.1 hypothetical protein [Bradyrhizobium elkanii]MCS3881798.1 hypothetical protein [Bradyrhizobium elkanii]MCS4218557.1 hypothetical protein [Bradyrhizobium elkanii]MCW2110146.1 hypothetical protein [Bradyrhizobium elkanii]MCW2201486.1 hypothetical protein [Bradyrhizobium elkanii]